MKKIAVLGASGFIGKNLCLYLQSLGYEVRAYGKSGYDVNFFKDNNIPFTILDFRHVKTLQSMLVGCDVVFHLTSSSTPKSSNSFPSLDLADGLVPTLDLLDVCVSLGVKQLVYTSSGGTVYGVHQYLPIDENHPTNPICAYGVSKLTTEHYMRLYAKLHQINMTVVRLANPYGRHQSVEKGQGVIAAYCSAIKNNQKLKVLGDGSVVRDYIHIDDVVQAYGNLMTDKPGYDCFNLGTGIGTSIRQVIEIFRDISHIPFEIEMLPSRDVDVPQNVLNVGKYSAMFNWQPTIKLHDGIVDTLNWWMRS